MTGSGDEEVEEWDDDVLAIEECLFCSKISKSLEANVKHMTSDHSFFLPDMDYLVDLEGLISYLGMLYYNFFSSCMYDVVLQVHLMLFCG